MLPIIGNHRKFLDGWFKMGLLCAALLAFSACSAPATATPLPPTSTLAPTATQTPAPSPTPTPPFSADLMNKVNETSQQAGWTIQVPYSLPEGYDLLDVYFDSNNQMVVLAFLATRPLPDGNGLTETKTLSLVEGLRNDVAPLKIAPEAQTAPVQVGNTSGAYLTGAWDTSYDNQSQSMLSTWRSDLAVQNIYWQQGTLSLVLISDDSSLSQSDLLLCAASVK